jgi:peptidoglycan/LPS O-acetylase OafA/YrhL
LPTFVVSGTFFRSTFRYSLQGLALMPFFFYAVHQPSSLPFRPLNWPILQRIGVYSYSIYLSHDIFINVLGRQGFSRFSVLVIAGALTIGYAALLHELVEKPFRGMRSRAVGHPAPAVAAVGGTVVERPSEDTLQPGRRAGTQPAFGRGRMP